MTTRRVFLQLLTSGVVGLSLVETEWIPTPITSTMVPASGPLVDIEAITAECLRRTAAQLVDLRGSFVAGDYRLGDGGFTDQLNVGGPLSDKDRTLGIDPVGCLEPIAHGLANEVRYRELQRFGALPLLRDGSPGAVASCQRTGLTIRGIQYYDIGGTTMYEICNDEGEQIGEQAIMRPPEWLMRFDIIGGKAA